MRRLAGAALLLAAWAQAETLTVLYTSDVHGHLLPYDEVRERPARGSLAQVATLVARLRAENPRTVVLDGGDTLQGTPLTHLVLADETADLADPTVAAMHRIGIDAAVLGNHEFNYGLVPLRRAIRQSRFPWLAANLGGAAAAGLKVGDMVVLERGGMRVAVIGLTNPNVPHWELPEHRPGLTFGDPLAAARRLVPQARQRADVVIVVAHTGFERELESGTETGSEEENFAWRLAELPGIDLLLTGHTHRDIAPRRLGATVVAQPGRHAELVTRVDLELERVGNGFRVTNFRGANLPVANEEPDGELVAAVEPARARLAAVFSTVIGELRAPLAVGGVATEDDPALDLVHAAQLHASGAQLSLAAPLAGAPLEFPPGPVTPRLPHALYPYPNSLVVVRLSGAQLRDVLEHAVAGWTGVDCRTGPPCTAFRDRRVPAYAFDTLEGADYAVDLAAPPGHRVRWLRCAGRPVEEGDRFTVVINSYRAAGGGSYPHLATAERVRRVDRWMPDILADYIRARGTLAPRASGNWAFTLPFRGVAVAAPAGVP